MNNSPCSFEGLVKFRRPGDRAGALDSGAGKNIVQWYLGGHRIGQKSNVEIQHDWKTAELTGGLGRVAILKIDYPFYHFFQRSGTSRTYSVANLQPRKVNSGARKTHLVGLMIIPCL